MRGGDALGLKRLLERHILHPVDEAGVSLELRGDGGGRRGRRLELFARVTPAFGGTHASLSPRVSHALTMALPLCQKVRRGSVNSSPDGATYTYTVGYSAPPELWCASMPCSIMYSMQPLTSSARIVGSHSASAARG